MLGEGPNGPGAHEQARQLVASTTDRPLLRAEFLRAFYEPLERRPYATAQTDFQRWTMRRGALGSVGTDAPGSPWWMAVNGRLLSDMLEADAYSRGAREGSNAPASTAMWLEFLARPSPANWYRAHNASIVAAYLEHEPLAARELPVERFLINVALLRALYAHCLVAHPRLALGRFSRVSTALGDPRRRTVGVFLNVGRVFPRYYPITDIDLRELLRRERWLARVLDYGVISARLRELYEFSAEALEAPGLTALLADGVPSYSWPSQLVEPWSGGRRRPSARLAARITRPSVGAQRLP
jgi:hypothetical protein